MWFPKFPKTWFTTHKALCIGVRWKGIQISIKDWKRWKIDIECFCSKTKSSLSFLKNVAPWIFNLCFRVCYNPYLKAQLDTIAHIVCIGRITMDRKSSKDRVHWLCNSWPCCGLASHEMVTTCLISTLILVFCHVSFMYKSSHLRLQDNSECSFHKSKRAQVQSTSNTIKGLFGIYLFY